MLKTVRPPLTALLLVAGLGASGNVLATSSEAVVNLAGLGYCASLTPEPGIKTTMPVFAPAAGSTHTVSGFPTPDATVTFTVAADGMGVESWSSDQPINFVVLTGEPTPGNRHTRVFHFGYDGVTSDQDETVNGTLVLASFCYGLAPATGPSEPGVTEMPDCGDLNLTPEQLDGTEISCPIVAEEGRVLISLDPDDPNFDIQFCTCNLVARNDNFIRCDPDKAGTGDGVHGETTVDGTCQSGEADTFLPITIEGIQDPHSKVCFTVNGQRRCYRH